MKFLSLTIFILLSFNTFSQEAHLSSNKNSCFGLILSFLKTDSNYVTFKNLPNELPPSMAKKPYPDKSKFGKVAQYNRQFFNKLISVEVKANSKDAPIKQLKENELYTFVVTEKEIRFAETSRERLSPKNFASKHAILARKETVYYAGEAWFEDGILVINHNSGTFQPNSEYLSDIALYFQNALNVSKVHFSSVLPDPLPMINYKSWIASIKAYARAKKATFSEGIIKLFARNDYQGKTITSKLSGSSDDDIVFTIADSVGSGFYGSVYKVDFQRISDNAKKTYPELFEFDKPSTNMVVKFPNDLPLLRHLPSIDIFEKSIVKEYDELKPLQEIAKQFGQDEANIVFQGKALNKTYLIKRFIMAHSIQALSKNQKSLTLEQSKALDRDIYQLALAMKQKLNLDLDIKAENLAWEPIKKKFVMYELSVRQSGGFTYPEGFKGYLDYFNSRLLSINSQRSPASDASQGIKLCSDNKLNIPSEFIKNFEAKSTGYEFDFVNKTIDLKDSNLSGCFKVTDISYQGAYQQINISLFPENSSDKFIEFAINKNTENKAVLFGFSINNHGPIAMSVEDSMIEK